jgi:predicted house-cleaning NTP pyrophosphatase (Maf/HAM1 superfamily)
MKPSERILELAKNDTVVNTALHINNTSYTKALEYMVITLVRMKNYHQNEVIRYIQKYGALEVEE